MPLPPPPSQLTLLPASEAVDALVAAEGNLALAAERLKVTQSRLVSAIAADPTAAQSLNSQLRTLATLHAFDTMRLTKVLVDASIADMGPSEIGKFYTTLLTQIGSNTDSHETTSNINITEFVLQQLSPEARQALMTLVHRDAASDNYRLPAPAPALPAPADAAAEDAA